MKGSSERIAALDAVRGLALLGVLLVNVETQFRTSAFERFVATPVWSSRIDALVAAALAPIETKPLVLFSFLFGLGLAAQHERERARKNTPGSRAVILRRLVFLLLLGSAHFVLLWAGDVLALYATVAIAATPFVGVRTRVLIAAAACFFVVEVLPLPYPHPFPNAEAMAMHVDAARSIYANAGYAAILRFRIDELAPSLALAVWGVPRTLGLFLLGMASWQSGALARHNADRVTRAAAIAVTTGAVAAWIVARVGARGPLHALAAEIADIGLAIGVGALVYRLADHRTGGILVRWLAPIGRMTLTSYLVQSFVLGFVFYGYGLGGFGTTGSAEGAAIALAIFAAQAAFAALWLRRFRLGPMEWLWRSFTRGAWQPMRVR